MVRATLQHVADAAGCSPAVASSVLNRARGNVRVSNDLRQRIVAAATKLSYRPNFAARSLVNQSTRTLGVYVTPHPFGSIAQPYEGGIFRGIEKACREHRFSLLILNLTGNETPEFCLEQIQEQRVDGLVLMQAQPYSDWERTLISRVGPMVVLGPAAGDLPVPSIDFDNAACIELAVAHLAELGHRRIGFIGSCLKDRSAHVLERKASFCAAMKKRGLPLPPEHMFDLDLCGSPIAPEHNYCIMEGYLGGRHMLKLPESSRPTALVAYNDYAASGVYRSVHEQSLRMQDTFCIVGIDNDNFCEVLTPRLTSVTQPLEDMGYNATQLLIAHLNGTKSEENDAPGRKLFGPKLMVRESTWRI